MEGGSPAAHNVVVVYQPRQTLVTPGAQQQQVTTIMVLTATPMSCVSMLCVSTLKLVKRVTG